MVIAQRLLRRLCQDCFEMRPLDRLRIGRLKVLDMPGSALDGVTEMPIAADANVVEILDTEGVSEFMRSLEYLKSCTILSLTARLPR